MSNRQSGEKEVPFLAELMNNVFEELHGERLELREKPKTKEASSDLHKEPAISNN